MASISNTFDGHADELAVTAANLGTSGDAGASVAKNNPTTIQYDSGDFMRGGMSVRFDFAASTAGYIRWNIAATSRVVQRAYYKFSDVSAGAETVMQMRNSSNLVMASVIIQPSGMIQASTSSIVSAGNSATGLVQNNVWYRLEVAVTKGTTSSNGKGEWSLYVGHSLNPIWSYTNAAVSTGTTDVAVIQTGRTGPSSTGTQSIWVDDFQAQELASGWIGPSFNTAQMLPFFAGAGW